MEFKDHLQWGVICGFAVALASMGTDPDVDAAIHPIRDGVMVARVRQ